MLRINHTDGTSETFTYNELGQVLTHTDGEGQTITYEYDKAIRLVALTNENDATYRFAYDDADRLIEEKRIDNLTRRFSYNLGGHLTQVEEIGYGEKGEQPRRSTHLEPDPIGRLLAKVNDDARQDEAYDNGDHG
ncbi:Cell-wall associated Rhs protein with YD-repeats and PAAR motif [Pseudomonas coronafaciens pv. atropurpurea]|nr:Cell-wall associated Rhs protein with YD-repeats and PAAR motif [Pseudomonas coronafaciens pv. atropurpurea]